MKKFYRNNRVLCILSIIVIICALISGFLLFKYFYFGNGNNKYGDRLEGIENIPITEEHQTSLINKIKDTNLVKDAKVLITGKIIYITITFNEEVSLVEAESVAVASLDEFTPEEKKFYDISFTLLEDETETNEGFTIMGAINAGRKSIVWNNNNPVTHSEESEQ